MSLDLTNLHKSIEALERSIHVVDSVLGNKNVDPALEEIIKAGVIQRFRVSFDLSWNTMNRLFQENKISANIYSIHTRNDLFRTTTRFNLVKDPLLWLEYKHTRNLSLHIYNQETANSVYKIARNFITDGKYFLNQLERIRLN